MASFRLLRSQTLPSAPFPSALEQAQRKKRYYSARSRVPKLAPRRIQKKKRSGNSLSAGVAQSQPTGKLLRQIGSKIYSKLRARIQPQRIAVASIKQQLN